MAIKTGIVPPGGWQYEDAEHRTEASGYPELVQAELTWRLQNQRVVGCVECDIEKYYAQKHPQWVTPGAVHIQVFDIPTRPIGQLSDRVHRWAIDLYRNPASQSFVTDHEALTRANRCVQCPRNKEWKGSCATCNNNAEQLLTMIRKNRDIGASNQLQACSAMGHCNRTAVWMQKDLISFSDDAPASCWMRDQ